MLTQLHYVPWQHMLCPSPITVLKLTIHQSALSPLDSYTLHGSVILNHKYSTSICEHNVWNHIHTAAQSKAGQQSRLLRTTSSQSWNVCQDSGCTTLGNFFQYLTVFIVKVKIKLTTPYISSISLALFHLPAANSTIETNPFFKAMIVLAFMFLKQSTILKSWSICKRHCLLLL